MSTAAMALSVTGNPDSLPARSSGEPLDFRQTRFSLAAAGHPHRIPLEQFIAARFSQAYGASIDEFFPLLLVRHDDEQISSVVGLRPGDRGPLFLEQYLDDRLETLIAGVSGQAVDRLRLIEVGNLASECRSGSQLLFILLTASLAAAGFDWVVFTATQQIQVLLKRLHFEAIPLCDARPERLTRKNHFWGSYYQSGPQVQAGRVADGMTILNANPYCAVLLRKHDAEIQSLAAALRAECDYRHA